MACDGGKRHVRPRRSRQNRSWRALESKNITSDGAVAKVKPLCYAAAAQAKKSLEGALAITTGNRCKVQVLLSRAHVSLALHATGQRAEAAASDARVAAFLTPSTPLKVEITRGEIIAGNAAMCLCRLGWPAETRSGFRISGW